MNVLVVSKKMILYKKPYTIHEQLPVKLYKVFFVIKIVSIVQWMSQVDL